ASDYLNHYCFIVDVFVCLVFKEQSFILATFVILSHRFAVVNFYEKYLVLNILFELLTNQLYYYNIVFVILQQEFFKT
ncbi:MAG: hypothetical protein Q8929_00735, partial [Bacillota bacterium]|nr:hypothetical protein [Bacillota bacterium]